MVQVRVSEGILEGESVQSALGRQYYSLKGIPYAQPPVGDLRFKAPQPPQAWNGVRSAKEYGPTCYQIDMTTMSLKAGNEDCLYLNVYTPNIKPSTPLPTMVWIHGGGFKSGSGNDDFYGPDFLIDKNVIIVTFNYRLEVVGFLCLDTPEIPGNAGMKDQVAALLWVQRNINEFGGDPSNVTIFGESAGGVSVSYHLVSPMSKGLFKRAIIQSGVMNCYWGKSFEPRERGLALARKLGYDGKDDKDLHEFFKSVPFESLVNIEEPIVMSEALAKDILLTFSVASEKQFENSESFFVGDIYENLRKNIQDVEVLIGYTADEGVLNLGFMKKDDIDDVFNRYLESFAPPIIRQNCKIGDQLQVGRLMKNYYFGNNKINVNNALAMLEYCSASAFIFDILQWIKFHNKQNTSNSYLYQFTCHSERNFMVHFLNASKFVPIGKPLVSHGDDLPYLFNMKIANLPLDQNLQSFAMIQSVTTLWTNFAKFGKPTPDDSLGVKWTPYSLEREDYLEVGEKLVPRNFPQREELRFWKSIFAQYLPHTLAP